MAGNNSLLSVLRATPLSNTIATQQWAQEEFTPISLLVDELSGEINPRLSAIGDKVVETAEKIQEISSSIPTVNDGVLTIQQNGRTLDTFSANSSQNKTVNVKGAYYAICDTTSFTKDKVAALKNTNETFVLEEGVLVYVKFINSSGNNSTAVSISVATLNVANTGAKYIYSGNTASRIGCEATYAWKAGAIVGFIYDGTYWIMLRPQVASTKNEAGVVRINDTFSNTTYGIAASAQLTKDVATSIAPYWVQNASTSYSAGDYVIYTDGKLYKAKVDILANTAWNASNWEAVTVTNEISNYVKLSEFNEAALSIGRHDAEIKEVSSSISALSTETITALSNVIDPKLDTISSLVSTEVERIDEISTSLSSYALSSSLNQVAFTGSYTDLSDVPEVFPASNGVLTINVNGISAGSFSADQSDNTVVDISVPLSVSQLSNDSDFATVSQIPTDYISSVVMNGDTVAVTDRSIDLGTILTAHQSLSDYALTSQLPIVNDGSLTIQRNGISLTSFTANQSSSVSVDIDVPLSVSQLANDSNFVSEAKATEIRNVLPISESTASSIQLTKSTYVYRVTDEAASGAFPTLVAPTDIENTGNYYFTFEIEWITAAALASYSQTFDWINWPEIVQGSESHTYYIAGRYDNELSSYTMNCWRTK